jgi:hypothetical protein
VLLLLPLLSLAVVERLSLYIYIYIYASSSLTVRYGTYMPPRALLAEHHLSEGASTVHDLSAATDPHDLYDAALAELRLLAGCSVNSGPRTHDAGLRISLASSESAARDARVAQTMFSLGLSILREQRTCFWPHFSGVRELRADHRRCAARASLCAMLSAFCSRSLLHWCAVLQEFPPQQLSDLMLCVYPLGMTVGWKQSLCNLTTSSRR